ncbi:MAG: protein of unknown function DUF755 [Anelloviridae sp.]|nr:MAG: protein of unknown function DUF755 [Anelloviridae sp.]
MPCTNFVLSGEDAQLQCRTSKTPANNPNSPCPVTSYKQYKCMIQQKTNKPHSQTLTNDDNKLQRQLQKELNKLKTVKHLYSQISSTHKLSTRKHRRAHQRKKRKPQNLHCRPQTNMQMKLPQKTQTTPTN